MGNATTPVLMWMADELNHGSQAFFVGMPPADTPATLIHTGNYQDLILDNDNVGGFSIYIFETPEQQAEMLDSLAEDGLAADTSLLATGETIALVHEIDREKGFYFDELRDGASRVDLRGSWGMTLDAIAELVPEAVEIAPAFGR